jgi:hypothetical protein
MTNQPGFSESPYSATGSVLGPLSDVHDPNREADLRHQALERMQYMNIQHAMYAWERRYHDPISPYGLAFLYVQPSAQGTWQELKAATKLWLDGPEAADPAHLLYNLNQVVTREAARVDFDIRRDLANRTDEGTLEDAWYVGLGLSSLDTYSGSWQAACATAADHAEIPGLALIAMIDSTVIACNRRGTNEFGAMDIRTTHPLATSTLDLVYPWSRVHNGELRADTGLGGMLRWLEELNLNLWRFDNARLVNRKQGWSG